MDGFFFFGSARRTQRWIDCDRRFILEHPFRCIRDSCPLVSIVRSSRVCQRFHDHDAPWWPLQVSLLYIISSSLGFNSFPCISSKNEVKHKSAFHLFYLIWLVCLCLKTDVPRPPMWSEHSDANPITDRNAIIFWALSARGTVSRSMLKAINVERKAADH